MEVEDPPPGVEGEEIDPLSKALSEKCPPLGDYLGEREHGFEHVKDRYLMNNWKRSLLKKEIPEKDGQDIWVFRERLRYKGLNYAGILHPRTNRPFTDQDIRNLNKGCANYLE